MGQKEPHNLKDDASLKRLAMGVFLQLPVDMDEAEQIIAHLTEMVRWHRGGEYQWLDAGEGGPINPNGCGVLPFMKRG